MCQLVGSWCKVPIDDYIIIIIIYTYIYIYSLIYIKISSKLPLSTTHEKLLGTNIINYFKKTKINI